MTYFTCLKLLIRITVREADEEEFKNKLRKLCEDHEDGHGYYIRQEFCEDPFEKYKT